MKDTYEVEEEEKEPRKNLFSLQDALRYLEAIYTITQIKIKMSEEAEYYVDVSENDYYLLDSLEVVLSNVKCSIMDNKTKM